MTQNKKFLNVFALFVLIPVILVVINNYLSENKGVEFSHDNRWGIAILMYFIALLANIYILKNNAREQRYKMLWNVVGIVGVIIFGVLLFLTNSFSRFGF